MKNSSPISLAAVVFLAAVAFTNVASAQTTNTWTGGNTTNNYNVAGNWSPSGAPNAVDSRAVFTAAASTSWTNSTNTLGSLLVSGGTLVIGNNGISTDVLRLAASSGGPVISNSALVFMYANVEGTQGFTKTGTGDLSFRFQTDNMSYTGNITMNAGSLTVNQDGSLGFSNNKILAASNSTLNINPGANSGNVTFASSREIVVSNGVTFNIQMGNTNITSTFSNPITGAGRVDFIANSAGATNQATSFRYTLAGANTYVGRTTIQMGAKVTLTNSSTLSTTNELSISGGSGTWAALDLGGSTANVATFAPASASTTARQIIISNGILNATNPSGAFSFNGFNGTVLDMSNLTAFSFGNTTGGTARNFSIAPDTAATANTNTVFFARGSNSITALTNRVGGAAGASQGPGNLARLFIGTNNTFNSAYMEAGGFNGEGTIDFMADVTNGAVKLRGTNGTDAMGTLVAGNTSAGTRSGAGRINLGIVDALVTDVVVGNFNANSVANLTTTNSLTMAGGTFNATNLYLGSVTNTNIFGASVTNNSSFVQNGGTSSITLIRMGDDRNTNATTNSIAYISTYKLGGTNTAVLRAQTIDAGTNAFFGANSVRTLEMSNGATLRNASGTNLAVTGFNSTAAGRMNISLAGNGAVEADSGQTVTFGANTRLSGAGDLTKTGTGTLILSSGIAGANTGALNISNGVVQLNATGVAAAGTVTSVAVGSGATLLISQSDQVNNSATVTLSGGTIQRASGVSETFGDLTLATTGTLDYVGGDSGTLQFGAWTPGSTVLTLNNFFAGNMLKFSSDLSSFISTTAGSSFSNANFSISGMASDGFTTDWNGSTFTIASIPEPSTYVAALGLLGLMLWPARRRLLALAVRK